MRSLIFSAILLAFSTQVLADNPSSSTPVPLTTPASTAPTAAQTQALQTLQDKIKQNNVMQPGTGIMQLTPDTVVAAGSSNLKADEAANAQSNSPRTTSGLGEQQSQTLVQSLNGSSSAAPLTDPDVIAAQKAAQSVMAASTK